MGKQNFYTGIDVEAIKVRVAEAEEQRKAELAEKLAPFRAKMAAKKAAEEKARADRDAERAAALQQTRQDAFDREYRTPAELAYLATGGTREDFAKLWDERLREETRLKIMDNEIVRRQRAARELVRSSF